MEEVIRLPFAFLRNNKNEYEYKMELNFDRNFLGC